MKVTQVFPETGVLATSLPQYLSDFMTNKAREGLWFVRSRYCDPAHIFDLISLCRFFGVLLLVLMFPLQLELMYIRVVL